MNKLLNREEFLSILSLFVTWKALLFISSSFALLFIPLYSHDLLGGGYSHYLQNPYLLPLANFDGEHYISIARYGYRSLQYFFLPFYPILISLSVTLLDKSIENVVLMATVISSVSFLMGLIILYKLLKLDYEKLFSLGVLISIIFFPTSFYFQSAYTESIFFLLSVSSFYFARKGNFFLASVLAGLASATKIIGVLLFFSLIIELLTQKKTLKQGLWVLIAPLGIIAYMQYLFLMTGDFFAFYNSINIFGEQREKGVVLLPQIIFRYLKIMYTLRFDSTFLLTTILEFLCGIIFFVLPILGFFKKIRYSYLFYSFFSILISTLPGSFSSVPRYVIVMFPGFIMIGLLLNKVPRVVRVFLLVISVILMFVENALFTRGYWVS